MGAVPFGRGGNAGVLGGVSNGNGGGYGVPGCCGVNGGV